MFSCIIVPLSRTRYHFILETPQLSILSSLETYLFNFFDTDISFHFHLMCVRACVHACVCVCVRGGGGGACGSGVGGVEGGETVGGKLVVRRCF